MRPVLYFIRHGETDWNFDGRLQGQSDTSLNAVGREQAAGVGDRLRDAGLRPEALPWLVSPLERATCTAELARKRLGLDPLDYGRDDRLKELSFGLWEGFTWRELRQREPAAFAQRAACKWLFQPPGGESYAMATERVTAWLASLHRASIVVSHGGIARVLMVLLGGATREKAVDADIWQGRLLVFEGGGSGWI